MVFGPKSLTRTQLLKTIDLKGGRQQHPDAQFCLTPPRRSVSDFEPESDTSEGPVVPTNTRTQRRAKNSAGKFQLSATDTATASFQPVPPGVEFRVDDKGDDKRDDVLELVRYRLFAPTWLVSFVVHLFVLVILALVTLTSGKIDEFLAIELTEPEAHYSLVNLDVMSATADRTPNELSTLFNQQSEPVVLDDIGQMIETEFTSFENGDLEQFDGMESYAEAGLDGPKPNHGQPEPVRPQQLAGEIDYFGVKAYGSRFVFVVDCSGSMRDQFRWERAKTETQESIMALTDEQQFFVFLYNHAIYPMGGVEQVKLVKATRANKIKACKWLEAARPTGGTFPWEAIRTSLKIRPDGVFLLSDGELADDTARMLLVENRAGDWEPGRTKQTPIHTIAFGKLGARTLQFIADNNSGKFSIVQ